LLFKKENWGKSGKLSTKSGIIGTHIVSVDTVSAIFLRNI